MPDAPDEAAIDDDADGDKMSDAVAPNLNPNPYLVDDAAPPYDRIYDRALVAKEAAAFFLAIYANLPAH